MQDKIGKVVIIGLGLIGGSIGMALKRRGAVAEVVGLDKNNNTLGKALELEAVDKVEANADKAFKDAELIIFAVPIDAVKEILNKAVQHIPNGCLVTDAASVKSGAIEIFNKILKEDVAYIGGHPMAGSENCGIEAADPFLFENAIYVVTPTGNESKKDMDTISCYIEMLGAKQYIIEHERHDFLVAMISHMPHLVAASLNLAVANIEDSNEAFSLAAGGFRDTTRVASSHPQMWTGICSGNSKMLSKALDIFKSVISDFQGILENNEVEKLQKYFKNAKDIRDSIPNRPGLVPRIYELIVTIPDRPGEIGRIGTILGDKEVNISEIEILRVREGDGGTMRLAFSSDFTVNKAQKILEQCGYKARKR